MTQPSLFDAPRADMRWVPFGPHCLFDRCGVEAVAVTESGLPLCEAHYVHVDELWGRILRPRRVPSLFDKEDA